MENATRAIRAVMRRTLRGLFLIVLSLLVGLAGIALADDVENHKVVNGVEIYLGILPAAMILEKSRENAERQMHGGVPSGSHRDHVVVALFDTKTGERIVDAQVKATVREIGLAGKAKILDSMEIAGTITYGNYFDLPSKAVYIIVLQIRRPNMPQAIAAEFIHRHYP